MRAALSTINDTRDSFTGTFVQYGTKLYKGRSSTTLLLKNICRNGEILTGHAWFTETEGFRKFAFRKGDLIGFCARVKQYKKGYVNNKLGIDNSSFDYKLSHPTQIELVKGGNG